MIPLSDLVVYDKNLRKEIKKRLEKVLGHGKYILGPEVFELEEKLAAYTQTKHCITVSSGTDALLISLLASGVGPGDEVITTPFTFAATAEVVALIGAIPVFVDIEPDTCNLDFTKIEEKVTDKTKAIIPVSLYGQPSNMDEINAIAGRHGQITVIEDAAQSFGSSYKGKKSCNLSTIGCTSFFPSKPLGCFGDGGAIFTNDDEIAISCRQLRVHGQSSRYIHDRIGIAGRMDTLQCAVLLAKLDYFPLDLERRISIGKRYDEAISSWLGLGNSSIRPVTVREDRTSVFGQYTILCEDRENVKNKLQLNNISCAVHYPIPLNLQKAYWRFCCPDCTPVATHISKNVLSIPLYPTLEKSLQERILEVLLS